MAVTPNYSWPIPVATDLVKDGYEAIADLGDAIDATVFGLPSSALSLIKTQVIGTTVSSVAVTSAFNTTYDNYKILVSGGVTSTFTNMKVTLGATVTGYYYSQTGRTFADTGFTSAATNAASWANVTASSATASSFDFDLQNPFLTKETIIRYINVDGRTGGSTSVGGGYLANATSYTEFTIAPVTGTMTGGTIYVYGYQK